jgi:hypothetical protein
MYDSLGLHWAAALPGFIALACIPFTWVFWKYGAKIRAKCKYSADAERQMNALIAARMAQMNAAKDEESNVEGGRTRVGSESTAAEHEPKVGGPHAADGAEATTNEKLAENNHAAERRAAHEASGLPEEDYAMYEALADRDEVDLSDDERLRLESLHQKFNYAKAKQ